MSIEAPIRVAFVRDDARRPKRAQIATVKAAGIVRVYEDWALLIRQRRKGHGDVVVVCSLYLVADPKRRTVKGGMRQSVFDRLREMRQVGASVFELDTGRSSSNEDERDAMLAEAFERLSQSRAHSDRIGRPPKVYTDDQKTIMRLHWTSMKHPTNRDALKAMADDGVRVSVQQVTKLLGPSGRKPGTTGPRPKKAPKRARKT
jgi:hypothetical protein